MISKQEAQDLMKKFIALRTKAQNTKSSKVIKAFEDHERICIEKFMYLVSMRTDRYRNFANYEDLNQEGLEALIKAMKNYDPKKGIFMWWAHKYIKTRISRSANLHTAIRFPLKYAKANPPHKETTLPLLIETRFCPDKNYENAEVLQLIQTAMHHLTHDQKNLIDLVFGFSGDKPLSINKICKMMNVSRMHCIKMMNGALNVLKQNILL